MADTTTQGNHAQATPTTSAAAQATRCSAPIDTDLTDSDLTEGERQQMRVTELHQAAYDALGRARATMLHQGVGRTRHAIGQTHTAIEAMHAFLAACGDPVEKDDLTPHQKVGLEATYQAEALLRALLVAAHGDIDELPFLLRATLPRLMLLNGTSMSAHDESDTADRLQDELHAGCNRMLTSMKGGAA